MLKQPQIHDCARYTLAVIRLINGVAALVVPGRLARRLGADPGGNQAALYALRLFGVRTILIGGELLLLRDKDLDRSLRNGVIIHASDALAAATAGVQGQLPRRTAAMATVISTLNLGLALVARGRKR